MPPVQNIHGILTAKETVNKLLLDSAYRTLVCESGTPRAGITYPGNGPGRTVPWPDLAMCVAASGQTNDETPMTVELPSAEGTVRVIVVPQAVPAPVVSRVSDRLGACRPAFVRDSPRYVVLESGTPRGLSRPWESSRVRRTSRTAACTPNRRTPTTSLTAAPTTRATARNSWAATKA